MKNLTQSLSAGAVGDWRRPMQLTCPCRGHVIVLKQPYQYHAGFNDRVVLYCDTCSSTLTFSSYNPTYVAIVGEKHPWLLTKREKKKVEDRIKPCLCGGRFRFDAPPRCPDDNCPLKEILEDEMHYIEVGSVIDGDLQNVWLASSG